MEYEGYISRLQEISEKKYKLILDLLSLTREQSRTITEDGLDKLDSLIKEKQARIDDAGRLDDEFSVYFQRLKSELKVKSLDELNNLRIKGVKELQETISKIMEAVKETVELEKQNSDKVRDLLETFGKEIKKINQGKKVNSAYNPGPLQSPSYFIDKKK